MKETGGPAFPGQWDHGEAGVESFLGMDLRDYFAAKALQGLIAVPGSMTSVKQDVEWAYKYADAMMEARK